MTQSDQPPRRAFMRWGVALAVVAWLTAAACGLWSELATRQRDRLAQQLATHALSANSGNVRSTIEHLQKLETSAVEPLVALAASQRHDIAEAAQRGLSHLLARWELAATESGDVATLATQAAAISAALDAHAGEFGPHGQRWANGLAERLIVHCDQFTSDEAWDILAHCDRVLSRPLLPKPAIALPAETPLTVETASPIPASPPVITPAAPQPAEAAPPTTSMAIIGRPLAELTLVKPAPHVGARRLPERFGSAAAGDSTDGEDQSADPAAIVPTGAVIDVPSPQEARLNRRRLRGLSDRQLAAKVTEPRAAETTAESTAARQTLQDRGYSEAIVRLTQQIEAMPPQERREALERASQLPPADARRLLRWFVADKDPDVRLQALTILATTGDPKLAELARERAIEDNDPRVSAFASELMRTR